MWFNPLIAKLLRSPLHRFVSTNMVLLTYRGHRSGNTYSLPVNYVEENRTFWITSQPDRTWWRNLRGGAQVQVNLRGQEMSGQAVTLEDVQAVADGLGIYLSGLPQAARYFGIKLDETGRPRPADLEALAQERVMVKVLLNGKKKEQ